MFCPSCGASVAETRFCENCGSPLPTAQGQTVPISQETQPVAEPVFAAAQETAPVEQPTVPVEQPYVAEVPGDAAWEAQPQQAYQVGQTMQMPVQPGQSGGPGQEVGSGHIPPTAPPSQPSYQQPASSAFSMNQAPSTAFILAIVGLVLSALFATFLPGIVCSIIALVLNAGYNKKGLDNKRKTSTMVIGIIGLVIGVLSMVLTIILVVTTAQVVQQIEEEGIDIASDSINVTTDSSGHINITVTDSSSASASTSASAASSASASSSAASASESSASPSPANQFADAKFHDADWNPTMYSLFELSGADMQKLLEEYNFYWEDEAGAWLASDGSVFGAISASGGLSKSQLSSLPVGGAGQPICFVQTVEGYDTPKAALSALTQDVVVERSKDAGDVYFAVAYGSPLVRYLVAVTTTDTNEQTVLVFTNESISSGLFASQTGVDAGSSIDEVWKVIETA